MTRLSRKLKELTEGKETEKRYLKLIKWLQKKKILAKKMECNKCGHKMKLRKSDCHDRFEW